MAIGISNKLGASIQRLRDKTSLDERAGAFVQNRLKPIGQNFIQAGRNYTNPQVWNQNLSNLKLNTSSARQNIDQSPMFKNKYLNSFVNNSLNSGQSFLSGAEDVYMGAKTLNPIKSFVGIGRMAAPFTPIFQGANLVASAPTNIGTKPNIMSPLAQPLPNYDQVRRTARGVLQGMSGVDEMASNVPLQKSLNVPLIGKVDPYAGAGSMYGYVQNPTNKLLFKGTEKYFPSKGNVAKWLTNTAARGGLENIFISIADVPENASLDEKVRFVLSSVPEGVLSEFVGQGISKGIDLNIQGLTKIDNKIQLSATAKKQLANLYDGLKEFKRINETPVRSTRIDPKTGQRIVMPMWKAMMTDQTGTLGGPQAAYWNEASSKFSSMLDKKPRFEIDDSGAKLKEGWFSKGLGGTKLDQVIVHDELFKQYPQLKNVTVNIENFQGNAFYDPTKNNITISEAMIDMADPKSSLLHEIQHAIQEIEGFAKGGSPEQVIKSAEDSQTLINFMRDPSPTNKQALENTRSYRDLLQKYSPTEVYARLSGELEARAVQRRMNMPANQRGRIDPYAEEAIATTGRARPDEFITRFESGSSALVETSEPISGMPTVKFQKPAIRGDITKLQKNLDEILGTDSFNATGKWNAQLPARATAKKQLEYYAEDVGDPDAKKILEYVNKLEEDIVTAQTSRQAISRKKPASIARTKLTGQQLDTPKKLTNQSNQIKNAVYNASANPDTVTKILQRNAKAIEKTAKVEFDQWQKNFFKSVNARSTTGAINDATKAIKTNTRSPISNPEQLQDLGGFASNFKDVYRNFKTVYGKNFDKVKAQMLDPFDKSKGAMVDEQIQLVENLDKKIVKGLGIEKGSKLSQLTQLFGEKKITLEQLKQAAGADYNKVVEADKFFRSEYDRLLTDVNNVMRKIYPNNPEKIIPKRNDYYRHYRDLAGLSGLKNIFDTPANISSKLAGVSDNTKPKSKWLSFAQRRLGDKSEIDAVGGYLDYIKAATYNKHIDQHTAKFRNLAQELAEATEEGPHMGKLNGFIEYLNDFANDLSGKSSAFDRPLQKLFGRKAFKALNWLNSRVKSNVILGNAASSIAQFFNIPQGIANAGPKHSITGAGRTLASIMNENPAIKQSDFIKERYSSSIFDRFDKGMIDNAKKFAVWMTGIGDEIGTKYIWNMHYSKALSENIQNPVKYADDVTRKLVAGRGIGEVPLIQKSKTFQLVAPFQLEVTNLWFVMKDFVDERAFGKLATLFIANHLMNKGAEAIRGNPVVFDPIQAMIDSYQAFTDEEENSKLRAGGRLAGEILSNVPGGSTAAQLYPEFGFSVGDNKSPTREDLFGSADPTRFGSGLIAAKGLQDPVFKILPPFGGNQIKRTIDGIRTTSKGYSESKTGRVRFPTENNPVRNIQRAIFGQYSTPNARRYFDQEQSVLGEKQSDQFKQLDRQGQKNFYDQIIQTRADNKFLSSAKDKLKQSNEQSMSVGNSILIKQSDGSIKTVQTDKPVMFPKLTGSQEIDKKLISKFRSELTSKENDIIELFQAGHMSQDEAKKQIKNINTIRDFLKQSSGGGGGGVTKSQVMAAYRRALKAQLGLSQPMKVQKSISSQFGESLRTRSRNFKSVI